MGPNGSAQGGQPAAAPGLQRYASGGGLILCRFRKASSMRTARLSGRVSIQSKSHCGSATAIGIFFKCGAVGFRPAPSRLPPITGRRAICHNRSYGSFQRLVAHLHPPSPEQLATPRKRKLGIRLSRSVSLQPVFLRRPESKSLLRSCSRRAIDRF